MGKSLRTKMGIANENMEEEYGDKDLMDIWVGPVKGRSEQPPFKLRGPGKKR